MEKGDIKIRKFICKQRECNICGEPATHCLTFLFDNARRNPASKGYGRDDISWCSDEEKYACEEHKDQIRRNPPEGMNWCSDFNERHLHRVLYWNEIEN